MQLTLEVLDLVFIVGAGDGKMGGDRESSPMIVGIGSAGGPAVLLVLQMDVWAVFHVGGGVPPYLLTRVLQSTQFFVLLPTPSTRRTSRTNHTDPSEHTPISNTTIDTSQSTHTHATRYLQPGNTSDPDHVAYSYAPTFLHGTLHRACTNDHGSHSR